MLVYSFYALPLLTVFTCGLKTPGCTWMLDWTIFFAGAMTQVTRLLPLCRCLYPLKKPHPALRLIFVLLFSQTQWCHIGASLHSRTPFTYRVPADKWWPVISLNVLLAVVPVLLALRCHISPAYFMKPVPEGQTDKDKKKN